MKLNDLVPNEGAKKNRKRVGRGIAAGQGKTCGRGTKGFGARAGSGGSLYRQGGNLPFFRRLPFIRGEGFTPPNQLEYNEINVEQLNRFNADTDVTPEIMLKARLINVKSNPVAILGRGELTVALKVSAHRVTEGAKQKIEAAGGTVEIIS
jgi:large subunit ribosomal protein L15